MSDIIAHFHPLLVHLPIGILVFIFIISLLPKEKRAAMGAAVSTGLIIASASAAFASVSGYLLSLSGEYDETLVQKHMWLGIATTVFCILSLVWVKYQRALIWVTTLVMAVAGHFGGSLTHGEDYLFGPKEVIEKKDLTIKGDSLVVETPEDTSAKNSATIVMHNPYQDEVKPVLQQKCYNCHSAVKKKGGLRLDSEAFILKGGKNGKILAANDPENSMIYTHLLLPLEDEMHMPPKGKKQLSTQEIKLIHRWIAMGAPFSAVATKTAAFPTYNTSSGSVDAQANTENEIASVATSSNEEKNSISVASDNQKIIPLLEKEMPMLDVSALEAKGMVTRQDAEGLSINFVNVKTITPEILNTLGQFSNNITELKMGGHVLTDKILEALPIMAKVKKLNLSKSDLSDKGLEQVKKFPSLQQLHVYETNISDKSIETLSEMKGLKRVILWNTKITDKGIRSLVQKKPELQVESGAATLRQADSTKSK